MAYNVVELNCPGCGAPVTTETQNCEYCGRPIVISTFNSVRLMSFPDINKQAFAYGKAMLSSPDDASINLSAAYCYLKLKLYDKALPCFEKAIADNFDNSEAYFYAAITLLKGKRAFLAPRSAIEKAEEFLNAALMIEPKGIYYYFWAYIRYDHHFRKFYKMNPDYKELLSLAIGAGLSQSDVSELYGILDVERPSEI